MNACKLWLHLSDAPWASTYYPQIANLKDPCPSSTTGSQKVVDVTPPVITLLPLDGRRFVNVNITSMTGLIMRLVRDDPYVEPGWIATDDFDAKVTDNVIRNGHEDIDTSYPTPEDAPWVISYNVKDYSGNIARTIYRLVYVDCPPPLVVCGPNDNKNYYCGVICGVRDMNLQNSTQKTSFNNDSPELRKLLNTPPVISLQGPPTVRIKQGTPYTVCPKGGESRTQCDLGAKASDAEDGDISYRLKVCDDLGYQNQTLFYFVGVTGCNITADSPPGSYTVKFTVVDNVGEMASATRIVQVGGARLVA